MNRAPKLLGTLFASSIVMSTMVACGGGGSETISMMDPFIELPTASTSPDSVILYFDGNPETFLIEDLAVALALFLDPSASTTQIQQIASEIFSVNLSFNQINGATPNPLSIFDLNGDGLRGQIEDLGVATALFLGFETIDEVNLFCTNVLDLICITSPDVSLPITGATPFPSSDPTEITFEVKDGVVVLEEGDIELISQDETSIVISGNVPTLNPGDVIISTLGEGALRTVLSINRSGEQTILATEQAALTDAFEELEFSIDLVIEPEAGIAGEVFEGIPGLRVDFLEPQLTPFSVAREGTVKATIIEIKYDRFALGAGIEITDGSLIFEISPQIDFSLTSQSLSISASPRLTGFVNFDSEVGGSLTGGLNEEYVPCSIALQPFRRVGGRLTPREDCLRAKSIMVGPVTLVPVFRLVAQLEGVAAGKFNGSITGSIGGEADISLSGLSGFSSNVSGDANLDIKVNEAEASLKTSLIIGADVGFLLYGIGDPFIGIEDEKKVTGETATRDNEEGILVEGSTELSIPYGVRGNLKILKLFDDLFTFTIGGFEVSDKFSLIGGKVYEEFFPFQGQGSIVVTDNGTAPDDVFEVSIDGVILGRTTRGGSGQFRITAIQPGERQLQIRCLEDDRPPCTYGITLANGVTFANGSTQTSGTISLGGSRTFTIVVPPAIPENFVQRREMDTHPPMPFNSVSEE